MSNLDKQQVLEQAIEWLIRMQENELSSHELEQLQQWQSQSAVHQKVWEKALLLQTKFSDVPIDLVIPVVQKVGYSSKQYHKKYLWLLALIPLCSGFYLSNQQMQWFADYRSGIGERKSITLPDGGVILLNAASAIDVEYTNQQRTIILRKGEIWIETRHDQLNRPFVVNTQQGSAQALGTKYLVKMTPEYSMVTVTQGKVRVSAQQSKHKQIVEAGQQLSFNAHAIDKTKNYEESSIAWTKGFLMVNEMSLKEFVARLQPYQKGIMRTNTNVENIKISGTYPIDHLEKVYAMLAQTYDLKIEQYAGGYFTHIQAAE
ncbi:FecR domain-containing protein [Acinetobacter sp. C26M]|uniref:FecR family protein n=1 Tax=unclassified Acinetobacter TaxID=196816 RepID=UPI002037065D|nr:MULTISPECIES: FecR domain-containing protein [unclassified Acinetobacter]USA44890.1 FecR domain-containing protein [Acinetobacter sp. C26M]USA48393.1 FecR domain-containing protein [Acinetobacter sp. C26G]